MKYFFGTVSAIVLVSLGGYTASYVLDGTAQSVYAQNAQLELHRLETACRYFQSVENNRLGKPSNVDAAMKELEVATKMSEFSEKMVSDFRREHPIRAYFVPPSTHNIHAATVCEWTAGGKTYGLTSTRLNR